MKIEILNIGNELLNGRILNQNASYLAKELTVAGFHTQWISVVGDDILEIVSALKTALDRAEVTIVTGGLGPTSDDLTCDAVCHFFSVPKKMDQDGLLSMEKRYEGRGIPITLANKKQVMIPQNSSPLPNHDGSASGFCIESSGHLLFFLPGVPHEMKGMFSRYVLKKIASSFSPVPLVRRVLRTNGVAESVLFERLGCLKWLESGIEVAFLPSFPGVDLEVKFAPGTEAQKVASIMAEMERKMGECIYSRSQESLEEVLAVLLTSQNKTLSVAESCTGGLVAHRITEVPGSSSFFKQGIVAYSNEAKVQSLGVSVGTLERFGAVSAQCAMEMANGVRKNSSADIGISTTGISGPSGETPLKPLGLVYVAYSDKSTCVAKKLLFRDSRSVHKERSAYAVLGILWRNIKDGKV